MNVDKFKEKVDRFLSSVSADKEKATVLGACALSVTGTFILGRVAIKAITRADKRAEEAAILRKKALAESLANIDQMVEHHVEEHGQVIDNSVTTVISGSSPSEIKRREIEMKKQKAKANRSVVSGKGKKKKGRK